MIRIGGLGQGVEVAVWGEEVEVGGIRDGRDDTMRWDGLIVLVPHG